MSSIQEEIKTLLLKLSESISDGILDPHMLSPEELGSILENVYEGLPELKNSMIEALSEAIFHENKKIIAALLRHIAISIPHYGKEIENMRYSATVVLPNVLGNLCARDNYIRWMGTKVERGRPFRGKGVIYTVLTGGYEPLKDPEKIIHGMDYICFTDDAQMQSNVWKMKYLSNEQGLDLIKLSRKPKIMFHQYLAEYDYSVYIDSKFQIIGDIQDYINKYCFESSMLACPHYIRSCLYEEAEICKKYKKDDSQVIDRQIERYRKEGFPENYGMIDAGFMVRNHHDKKLIDTMETWWEEYTTGSKRDQLSFTYACWKNGFSYDLSDIYIENNIYFFRDRKR